MVKEKNKDNDMLFTNVSSSPKALRNAAKIGIIHVSQRFKMTKATFGVEYQSVEYSVQTKSIIFENVKHFEQMWDQKLGAICGQSLNVSSSSSSTSPFGM